MLPHGFHFQTGMQLDAFYSLGREQKPKFTLYVED